MVIEKHIIKEYKSNWRNIFDIIKSKSTDFLLGIMPINEVCVNHQEISEDQKAITYKVYNSNRKQIGELEFRIELV